MKSRNAMLLPSLCLVPLCLVPLCLVAFLPLVGYAEEILSEELVLDAAEQPANTPDRWIGIAMGEVPDVVRSHIDVDEGVGLMVVRVMEGSPAQKAGIRRNDILVGVNGKPLMSMRELVEAVQGDQDGTLQLEWLRRGKRMTEELTTVERPQSLDEPIASGDRLTDPTVRSLMEQLKKNGGDVDAIRRSPLRFRMIEPNYKSGDTKLAIPNGLKVQIHKENDEPTKIKVESNGTTWELTEDDLSELPDDIRPHVERLLGRGNGGLGHFQGAFRLDDLRDLDLRVEPHQFPFRNMEQEFERMNRRMDRLFEELRGLQLERNDEAGEKAKEIGEREA